MAQRSWLPLVFAAAAGCSTSHVDGPIDYRTTGGFSGGGDGTALHIELDGTATRPTPGGSAETATLDAATLQDLDTKILDARFEALAPMYPDAPEPDFLIDQVSVQVNGDVHTVQAEQSSQIPAPLKTVIDTLKDIRQRPLGWH